MFSNLELINYFIFFLFDKRALYSSLLRYLLFNGYMWLVYVIF